MSQNTAGTTTGFLENLRSETALAHKNLESIPVSASILDPSVTKQQYGLYLQKMLDVVSSLEKNIYPELSGIVEDLDLRVKSSDIAHDLNHIGISVPTIQTDVFTSGESTAFNLGIMYVVEGSALGGRFILKNIEATLGYDHKSGASYFSGYGNKTGSMWKSFLEKMTDYASETGSEKEIIAGANFAFKAIHEHLERP